MRAPLRVHRGNVTIGKFARHKFEHRIASEEATEVIRHLNQEGFDVSYSSTAEVEYSLGIPLAFLGIDGQILPLFVNAYVPPQPRMERYYALGEAINRALKAQGLRAVVMQAAACRIFPVRNDTPNRTSPLTKRFWRSCGPAICGTFCRWIKSEWTIPAISNCAGGESRPVCWANGSRIWFHSILPGTTTKRHLAAGRRKPTSPSSPIIPLSHPSGSI